MGAKHLRDALTSEQCQLTHLYLTDNHVTNEGVKCVCDAFPSNNCKLACLYLIAVGMTSKGGMLLVTALESSECKLTELHLTKDEFDEDCVKSLEKISRTKHIELCLQ